MAVCDVDQTRCEKARGETQAATYEDYRALLERQDIDIITIGTPDHWHTKIAIDAMQAGKDVYCEKPMTLTIAEGQQLIKVVRKRERFFRWERSNGVNSICCSSGRSPP